MAIDEWVKQASCKGMDTNNWFPVSNSANNYDTAYAICKGCPVADECLQYAISTESFYGMFGGLKPFQRRAVQKRTATAAELRADNSIPHGTEAGFAREIRHGVVPCGACHEAKNKARRDRRAIDKAAAAS